MSSAAATALLRELGALVDGGAAPALAAGAAAGAGAGSSDGPGTAACAPASALTALLSLLRRTIAMLSEPPPSPSPALAAPTVNLTLTSLLAALLSSLSACCIVAQLLPEVESPTRLARAAVAVPRGSTITAQALFRTACAASAQPSPLAQRVARVSLAALAAVAITKLWQPPAPVAGGASDGAAAAASLLDSLDPRILDRLLPDALLALLQLQLCLEPAGSAVMSADRGAATVDSGDGATALREACEAIAGDGGGGAALAPTAPAFARWHAAAQRVHDQLLEAILSPSSSLPPHTLASALFAVVSSRALEGAVPQLPGAAVPLRLTISETRKAAPEHRVPAGIRRGAAAMLCTFLLRQPTRGVEMVVDAALAQCDVGNAATLEPRLAQLAQIIATPPPATPLPDYASGLLPQLRRLLLLRGPSSAHLQRVAALVTARLAAASAAGAFDSLLLPLFAPLFAHAEAAAALGSMATADADAAAVASGVVRARARLPRRAFSAELFDGEQVVAAIEALHAASTHAPSLLPGSAAAFTGTLPTLLALCAAAGRSRLKPAAAAAAQELCVRVLAAQPPPLAAAAIAAFVLAAGGVSADVAAFAAVVAAGAMAPALASAIRLAAGQRALATAHAPGLSLVVQLSPSATFAIRWRGIAARAATRPAATASAPSPRPLIVEVEEGVVSDVAGAGAGASPHPSEHGDVDVDSDSWDGGGEGRAGGRRDAVVVESPLLGLMSIGSRLAARSGGGGVGAAGEAAAAEAADGGSGDVEALLPHLRPAFRGVVVAVTALASVLLRAKGTAPAVASAVAAPAPSWRALAALIGSPAAASVGERPPEPLECHLWRMVRSLRDVPSALFALLLLRYVRRRLDPRLGDGDDDDSDSAAADGYDGDALAAQVETATLGLLAQKHGPALLVGSLPALVTVRLVLALLVAALHLPEPPPHAAGVGTSPDSMAVAIAAALAPQAPGASGDAAAVMPVSLDEPTAEVLSMCLSILTAAVLAGPPPAADGSLDEAWLRSYLPPLAALQHCGEPALAEMATSLHALLLLRRASSGPASDAAAPATFAEAAHQAMEAIVHSEVEMQAQGLLRVVVALRSFPATALVVPGSPHTLTEEAGALVRVCLRQLGNADPVLRDAAVTAVAAFVDAAPVATVVAEMLPLLAAASASAPAVDLPAAAHELAEGEVADALDTGSRIAVACGVLEAWSRSVPFSMQPLLAHLPRMLRTLSVVGIRGWRGHIAAARTLVVAAHSEGGAAVAEAVDVAQAALNRAAMIRGAAIGCAAAICRALPLPLWSPASEAGAEALQHFAGCTDLVGFEEPTRLWAGELREVAAVAAATPGGVRPDVRREVDASFQAVRRQAAGAIRACLMGLADAYAASVTSSSAGEGAGEVVGGWAAAISAALRMADATRSAADARATGMSAMCSDVLAVGHALLDAVGGAASAPAGRAARAATTARHVAGIGSGARLVGVRRLAVGGSASAGGGSGSSVDASAGTVLVDGKPMLASLRLLG